MFPSEQTYLNLSGTKAKPRLLTEQQLREIADSRFLRRLELWNTNLTDAGMWYFSRLALLELNIGQTKVTDAGLVYLSPTMQRLNLCGFPDGDSQITDDGIVEVAKLRHLTLLSLGWTQVTDYGLSLVSGLPIRYLELWGTNVTNAGLPSIPRRVKSLDVPAAITDAGLPTLAGLTQLQVLNLGGCAVTDAGLPTLFPMTWLKRIYLRNMEFVTSTGVAALRTALPKLTIYR
jgi:hypothetical protein